MKRAVVLLSGGLDSATTLFFAKRGGFKPRCLIFDYGQRHRREINQARKIAKSAGSGYHVLKIAFPWKGSALLDDTVPLPGRKKINSSRVPATYVPGRNIIFLSFAVSFAEVIGARSVFIGANAVDYSGYPDCRPDFIKSFQRAVRLGTKAGTNSRVIKIHAPLIKMTKAEIIKTAVKLKVPVRLTWSCYKGGKSPCGMCESCRLRAKGFLEAGVNDPLTGVKK